MGGSPRLFPGKKLVSLTFSVREPFGCVIIIGFDFYCFSRRRRQNVQTDSSLLIQFGHTNSQGRFYFMTIV